MYCVVFLSRLHSGDDVDGVYPVFLAFSQLRSLRVRLTPWLLAVAAVLVMPVHAQSRSASDKPHVAAKKKATAKAPRSQVKARAAPARPSMGHRNGLHAVADELDLKSSVALVLDQDTDEVLFSKNSEVVLPIASITKLMTALVVAEANLPLDEMLKISAEDVDSGTSRSRLRVGTKLSREEMLHLALMSSENRAAHALGRHYPGGITAFVAAMNSKAQALGMHDTQYVEPTGLSSLNRSSATDLAVLVRAADKIDLIRQHSTSPAHDVAVGSRNVQFRNTNGLVRSGGWDIGLQKTGYISEAGRCLVMQAQVSGRKLIMVLLDSAGKYSRIGDAERIRKWLSALPVVASAPEVALLE